jgi:hypothetical protein
MRSAYLALSVAALLSNGCVKKYVEVRVRDGSRVGVGAPAGRGYVPILAPDGSQGTVYYPAQVAPITVVRQGYQVSAVWAGANPVELVNAAGALPPLRPGEGLEVRDGLLYAYYGLLPGKVVSASEPKVNPIPVALSTPVNNIAEAVEIHEPRYWPAYVFLPTGGAFTLIGSALFTIDNSESKLVGATYALCGIPMLVVGLVNALQTSEAVPITLAPGPPAY